jgi:GT2 family glycosyltransferase
MNPLISIITPCFNSIAFIAEAMQSVLAQDANVEHLVIDGGSTDGTQEILRAFPGLKVTSEPDEGMYDAINKGLAQAQGEWIGLLNSDDLYPPDTFRRVREALQGKTGSLAVAGAFSVFVDEAGIRRSVRTLPAMDLEHFPARVVRGSIALNAWFFHRQVFERLGNFDTRYRYASDREFLIRLALTDIRPITIPAVTYQYRQHSGSATLTTLDSRSWERGRTRMTIISEGIQIQESYLGTSLPPDMRREMISAHSKSCYKLTATALYHRQFKLAGHAIRQGWRYDRLWPLVFIQSSLARLGKELT